MPNVMNTTRVVRECEFDEITMTQINIMERFGVVLLVILLFMEPVAAKSMWKRDEKKCKVHRSPPVHHVMDQICLLCHEMFSHEAPNLRAECRANCFRNDRFTACLAMFSSKNRAERDS